MSRWKNNGGWNKSHGTVEKTPRIDSYEAGAVENYGTLFAYWNGKMQTFDCDHYTDYGPDVEREIVEVYHPKYGWCQHLELSRKINGLGGSQAFFLCPVCGGRVRYLYLTGRGFRCRKCSRLNYRSQQETRSDNMYFYRKGCDLAKKHLSTWIRPDRFSFCRWIPERPCYMHQTTYRRYLRRFVKYQDQHQRRQLEDMARLLRLFK